ncbi:MAG: FctA domain-containing protein, partial [Tissierellia bacterium]|nr:FctA domain-containing protein [Tissierellia bacterium]
MNKKNINRIFAFFLSIMMVLTFVFTGQPKVEAQEAKELKNVLTEVGIYKRNDGRENLPNSDGVHVLVRGNSYAFWVKFDLSAYNGIVKDGDYFMFDVPAPFNLKDKEVIEFTKEGLVLGVGTVTSNGDQKGGSVKVVLQNLEAYRLKLNSDTVKDIKGDFFMTLDVSKLIATTSVTFTNFKNLKDVTIKYLIKKSEPTDNSGVVGKENFAKYMGVIAKRSVTSETFGYNGEEIFVHPWRIRINASKKHYNTMRIKDRVSQEHGPMQFIPETFELTTGSKVNQGYQLDDKVTLVKDVDYTIQFFDNYQRFEIEIKNSGNRPYMLDYYTTSPADGSDVGNIAQLFSDETPMTIADDRNTTESLVTRSSKYSQGGTITIDVAYKIILYKSDKDTNKPIQGVEFEVRNPDGSFFENIVTNEMGRAMTSQIDSAVAKQGEFTIIEKTPLGYKNENIQLKLRVGEKGAIRQIKNERTKINFTVNKSWVSGDAANRPVVEFQLYRDGVKYGPVKQLLPNQNQVIWENLPEYKENIAEGKSVYTVEELPVEKYKSNILNNSDNYIAEVTNTFIKTPVDVVLSMNKELIGKQLTDGAFEFELVDKDSSQVLQKVSNNEVGDIVFNKLTFTEAVEKKYIVREIKGKVPGIVYDENQHEITVKVTENNKGELIPVVEYATPEKPKFVNRYETKPALFAIEAKKELIGKGLLPNMFEFELFDVTDNKTLGTNFNNSEGKVIFNGIKVDKAGEKTYRLKEVKGILGGIAYDANEYLIKVNVTDNGLGQLVASIEYPENKIPTFVNTYTAKQASVILRASKELSGKNLEDGAFSFEIFDVQKNRVIDTVTNKADGEIIFNQIYFQNAGRYNFVIRELAGSEAGITYDDRAYNVEVVVTDNGSGQLIHAINYADNVIPKFINSYKAKPTNVKIEAKKILENKDLEADQFEFELKELTLLFRNRGSEPIISKTKNDAEGNVIFTIGP